MTEFALTWDYRCPYARIAHLHVLDGLAHGAPWDVRFVPFSLGQVHVAEGETPIWERPADDSGLLALQAGVVARDRFPQRFLEVHRALFDLRHVQAVRLDEANVGAALTDLGLDAGAVFAEIAEGGPLDTIRKEHEAAAREHDVWGVPTFLVGGQAVFVRLNDIPDDPAVSVARIDRVLDLAANFSELNEFKHTTLAR